MKLKEAIQLLKEHNLWRRYDGKIGEGTKIEHTKSFCDVCHCRGNEAYRE